MHVLCSRRVYSSRLKNNWAHECTRSQNETEHLKAVKARTLHQKWRFPALTQNKVQSTISQVRKGGRWNVGFSTDFHRLFQFSRRQCIGNQYFQATSCVTTTDVVSNKRDSDRTIVVRTNSKFSHSRMRFSSFETDTRVNLLR